MSRSFAEDFSAQVKKAFTNGCQKLLCVTCCLLAVLPGPENKKNTEQEKTGRRLEQEKWEEGWNKKMGRRTEQENRGKCMERENTMDNVRERKHYVDNIRWITVLLVVFYHVLYIFNSVGVIKNIAVNGIKILDAPLYFINPWFMALLFVAAGMSARYSLAKRTAKEFAKERVKRLLVPSVAGIFLLGWFSGWVTDRYVDMFQGAGEGIPGIVKYLIYCLCGIGPLWFAHELFLLSMILLLIRRIDKRDRLYRLGSKMNMAGLLLLVFAVWGSSNVLNTPLLEAYRNGIYGFMFLCGYYVFSHERVTDLLVKWKVPLAVTAIIAGVAYTVRYFGENYTAAAVLGGFFTNAYAWLMILAVFGCGKAWLNGTNGFCRYMIKCNFGFYALHYPLLMLIAYLILHYVQLPMLGYYAVILLAEVLLLPVAYEMISRIPGLRFLLLGITANRQRKLGNVEMARQQIL